MVEVLEDRALPSIGVYLGFGGLELFDTNNPTVMRNDIIPTGMTFASGGLVHHDGFISIDCRPATGQLYGLARDEYDFGTYRLYKIDLTTGAATQIGGNITVDATGLNAYVGMGFDPATDLIRVTSNSEINTRVDPDTGAVVGVDTNFSAGSNFHMVAYGRMVQGASGATCFAIAPTTPSTLVRVGGVDGNPSANGAEITNIGPLGWNTDGFGGFGVASDGIAYAVLRNGFDITPFGTIDLTTGAFTQIVPNMASTFGGVIGFTVALDNTIIPPPSPPPAPPPAPPQFIGPDGIPTPPQILHFQYRRTTVDGYVATIAQVQGVSLTNATLGATVDASDSKTQAVGLFARSQSNGDMYVGMLTHDGMAQIWLFHGTTNTYTVLKSVDVGTNTGYFQFQVVNSTSLSLFLNNNPVPVVTVTDSSITSAGGVGLFTWGNDGRYDNFMYSGS
jgi:hypothetical protein